MTRSSGRVVLVVLACSLAALDVAAQTVSQRPSRVAAAGKTVPVADCGAQAPAINGDLADWGDLRRSRN